MPDILLVTKGHPYERTPFFAVFDAMQGVECTHVEQPAAQVFFDPVVSRPWDALVFYDMPGIRFLPGGPQFDAPDPRVVAGFEALTRSGKGLVFMHHAIAGWPAWPEYGEVIGGRFLYLPTEVRGQACMDSGYRHGVRHTVRKLAEHPVTAGVPDSFEMTDELYLGEVFTDDIIPLLASSHAFVDGNFYSAALAVREGRLYDRTGWHHPPGSNLLGWVKRWNASPVVYLQGGDDPVAYANPHWQRLLRNAIEWVASDAARAWAASGPADRPGALPALR